MRINSFIIIIIMRQLNNSIVLILTIFLVNSNIWDNIYSQTQADSPIIIDESLNLVFRNNQYDINVMLDYNSQLQIITLKLYYNLFSLQAELMSFQLDLKDYIMTYKRVDRRECQNILLTPLQAARAETDKPTLGKERLFLVNVLFEFKGKKKLSGLNIYKFQPVLFPTKNISKLQTEINTNLKSMDKDIQDFQLQDLDIYFYLYVNSKTGNIQQVHYGENQEQEVPIKTKSTIRKKLQCKSAVRQMTNKQFSREVFNFLKKNKSNYDKFFKT